MRGLHISDRCNENTDSLSIIVQHGGYDREGMTEREYLLGSNSRGFIVSDYEVFQVELI
jgi:hypothetical protein